MRLPIWRLANILNHRCSMATLIEANTWQGLTSPFQPGAGIVRPSNTTKAYTVLQILAAEKGSLVTQTSVARDLIN